MELKGIPCIELFSVPEKKQSIACTRTFGQKIGELAILQEAIASFAARASEKLRAQKSKARFLSVFLTTSPFSETYEAKSCHFHLPHATSYAPEFITLAKVGIDQIYRKGFLYKRAGVLLTDFEDEEVHQLDLYSSDSHHEKKAAAMRAIDEINAHLGKSAVWFLAEGEQLQGSRKCVTPHYTTDWNDLLVIKEQLQQIYAARVVSLVKATPEESEAIEEILSLSIDEIKRAFREGFLEVSIRGKTRKVPFRDSFLAYALLLYEIKYL